ncbi:MAG: T9SS type A sorting domain-containing protein [Niastella sp.]|nr:T9SS type A sorting domain-containing protein [Niastella sp.]
MKNKLYAVLSFLLIIISLLGTSITNAQTWGYRAGYGTTASGTDRGLAIATDASGNVYITGSYVGQINFGLGNLPLATANDIYVAKFNSAGTCQWAVAFPGGASNDVGFAIATDGTSVYVGGNFTGSLTVPPLAPVAGTSIDGFIAKLNASTGAGIWVSTVNGSSVDNVQALCLDGTGNVYASGNFLGSANFGGPGISRTANGGSNFDLFVAQLNPSTGAFNWVSTGGSSANPDNGQGSSLTYVAALNEIIVTGSYSSSNATYTTTTPASSVSLTNAGSADICILEVNAANGAFISGIGVGGSLSEEGLAITYDAFTQDVVLAGYFASSSITFGSNPALTNASGTNDIFYARYSPDDNSFTWSKAAGSGAGVDRANGIASDATGGILIVGAFRGTLNWPTNLASPLTITNSRTNGDDIFLARVNAETGNGQLLGHGQGDDLNTISNQGLAVAAGTAGNVWITGSYGSNLTLSPLAVLAPSGTLTSDVLLARYNDPLPLTATQSQTPVTCNVGCNGTATVTPSGGVTPYTYAWTPNVSTTGTATGFCVGATPSVTVTDAIGNTVTKNYTITMPATQLATANTTNTTFVVSASNNNMYDASCNLIATLVPNGASPVSGTVAARVWFEAGVPVFPAVTGKPYVARHYEIQPATNAATATGRVTLYFTQLEFNNFNAAPGSTANLPTGPSDAAGKANVRFSKFAGASNNPATGTPGTYTGTAAIIDPVDSDIIWNATQNRWEITFDVVGFSGFFLQTSTFILPVTWVYVNGSLNAQGQPVITWKVQEEQVASYSIERAIEDEPFTAIATITSKGNGEHDYSFQEVQALSGKASYRIKQTDLNGRATYSRILLLKSDRKGWVTLYPNPVKGAATLNVTDKELINTTAYLYDGTGRELQRIQITQSITILHMEQYKSGVYTLKLKNGQTMRILKE